MIQAEVWHLEDEQRGSMSVKLASHGASTERHNASWNPSTSPNSNTPAQVGREGGSAVQAVGKDGKHGHS